MENALSKVRLLQVVRRKARVIEYCPIHIHNTAIRSKDNDSLRYRIDHLSELPLRLFNLLECRAQSRLRLVALNCDSGDAARVVDQLNFVLSRAANFAKVHTERPQHLSIVRRDRARPTSEQSGRERFVPEIHTIGVG